MADVIVGIDLGTTNSEVAALVDGTVEVVQTLDAAPGTVLEVFRPGYTSNGRVVRVAEVKVVGGMPATAGE